MKTRWVTVEWRVLAINRQLSTELWEGRAELSPDSTPSSTIPPPQGTTKFDGKTSMECTEEDRRMYVRGWNPRVFLRTVHFPMNQVLPWYLRESMIDCISYSLWFSTWTGWGHGTEVGKLLHIKGFNKKFNRTAVSCIFECHIQYLKLKNKNP